MKKIRMGIALIVLAMFMFGTPGFAQQKSKLSHKESVDSAKIVIKKVRMWIENNFLKNENQQKNFVFSRIENHSSGSDFDVINDTLDFPTIEAIVSWCKSRYMEQLLSVKPSSESIDIRFKWGDIKFSPSMVEDGTTGVCCRDMIQTTINLDLGQYRIIYTDTRPFKSDDVDSRKCSSTYCAVFKVNYFDSLSEQLVACSYSGLGNGNIKLFPLIFGK